MGVPTQDGLSNLVGGLLNREAKYEDTYQCMDLRSNGTHLENTCHHCIRSFGALSCQSIVMLLSSPCLTDSSTSYISASHSSIATLEVTPCDGVEKEADGATSCIKPWLDPPNS